MACILVIDDEAPVRETLRVILEREGHRVETAEGSQRSLADVDAGGVDVVIVDIFMPGMDGFEASRPVPDFLKMAEALGATCCLQKPFKTREIITAVEKACAQPAQGPVA